MLSTFSYKSKQFWWLVLKLLILGLLGYFIYNTLTNNTKITWEEFQEFYAKVKEDPEYGSIRMFRKLDVGEYVTDELRRDYTPPKVFNGANLYEKTPSSCRFDALKERFLPA